MRQASHSIAHPFSKGEGSYMGTTLKEKNAYWQNECGCITSVNFQCEEDAKRRRSRVTGGPRHPAIQLAPGP